MKFYNREKEIHKLKAAKKSSKKQGAQLVVIIGRRRIGKSALMKQAFKKNESIYFFVSKKNSRALLTEFTDIYNQHSDISVTFSSWEDFFHALFKLGSTTGKTILIDEFQDFSNIRGSNIFSVLQKLWEEYQHQKNLIIIVAGSIISLLENIFYSQKEPLYGRATRKLFLDEFTFQTVYKILNDHLDKKPTLKTLIHFYTIFGGSPYYYTQIENEDLFKRDIFAIVKELILDQQASMKNEGREVLTKEFGKEHSAYFSILEAISTGENTFTAIANYTGSDPSYLLKNLRTLEEKFRLIKKQVPIFPNNRNTTRYAIVHNFLLFWFRYVYKNQSSIEIDQSSLVLKKVVNELDTLAGYTFEKLCAEFLLDRFTKSQLGFEIRNMGRWWDRKGEVDIVIDGGKDLAVFVECKMSQNQITQNQIDKLLQTSHRVNAVKHRKKRYLFMVGDTLTKKTAALLEKNNVEWYDFGQIKGYLGY